MRIDHEKIQKMFKNTAEPLLFSHASVCHISVMLVVKQFRNIQNSAMHCRKLEYMQNSATSMFGNSVILQQILQLGPLAKEQGPGKSCTLNFEPGRTF